MTRITQQNEAGNLAVWGTDHKAGIPAGFSLTVYESNKLDYLDLELIIAEASFVSAKQVGDILLDNDFDTSMFHDMCQYLEALVSQTGTQNHIFSYDQLLQKMKHDWFELSIMGEHGHRNTKSGMVRVLTSIAKEIGNDSWWWGLYVKCWDGEKFNHSKEAHTFLFYETGSYSG